MDDSKVGGGDAGRGAGVGVAWAPANETTDNSSKVETLKRFSLLVNMQVARSLRLYPPIDMLNYAEVIAVGPTEAHPS